MTSEQITVTDVDREAAWKAFENWFFRECVFGARRHLYAMFDMPLNEIRNHGHERHVLRHIRKKLQGATSHRTEAEARVMKHAEAMAKELAWYADFLCEGFCEKNDPKLCASIGRDECAGCPAVGPLAAYRADYPEKNDDQ